MKIFSVISKVILLWNSELKCLVLTVGIIGPYEISSIRNNSFVEQLEVSSDQFLSSQLVMSFPHTVS